MKLKHPVKSVCRWCGRTFVKRSSFEAYCSDECRLNAIRKNRRDYARRNRKERKLYVKACEVCGKTFETFREDKKTCCKNCCAILYRRNETPEHRKKRLSMRMEWVRASMTPEKRKEENRRARARYHALTPEQKRQRWQLAQARMTPEQKERMLAWKRAWRKAYNKTYWANMDPEKKERMLARRRKNAEPRERIDADARREKIRLRARAFREKGIRDFENGVISNESLYYMSRFEYNRNWTMNNKDKVKRNQERHRRQDADRNLAAIWLGLGVVKD